ncbi:MAG: tRNA isopentenyl-2-thiomethyl-A-37 hydroxylase MiaE [Kofleriaceae bacterium]
MKDADETLHSALPLRPTDPRWLELARGDLDAVHRDHLHCERKAAQSALSLVRSYPTHERILLEVSRLAHEETRHVVQVAQLLRKRGTSPGYDHGDEYAARLRALVRRDEPARLLDRLLVFAVIEGRSAERLRLLAGALEEPGPAALYASLADAEVRHRDTFLSLAAEVAPTTWRARAAELADAEAAVVATLPLRARIH